MAPKKVVDAENDSLVEQVDRLADNVRYLQAVSDSINELALVNAYTCLAQHGTAEDKRRALELLRNRL